MYTRIYDKAFPIRRRRRRLCRLYCETVLYNGC